MITVLLLSAGLQTVLYAAPPLSGGGTETDPYLISSKADVMALQKYVNGQVDGTSATSTQVKAGGDACAGMYFALTSDIDMASDTTFIGIGTVPYGRASATSWVFSGTIDGRGHTIRNMRVNGMVFKADGSIDATVNGSRKYLGFIGCLDGGVIRNLHFGSGCSVTGNGAVGIIAGRMNKGSRVEGCSSSGIVRSYGNYAGGIAGDVTASSTKPSVITGCWNMAAVYANTSYAGGIAGGLYCATVENCLNTGDIQMHSFHPSKAEGNQESGGGIVGYAQSTSVVRDCLNAAAVSVSKQYAGGIVGRNSSATKSSISGCVALGYVDCPSLSYKGMISGGIPSTAPAFENNYYDGSLWGVMAVAVKEMQGCTSATTQALTSGTLPQGLDAGRWQALSGLYPQLKLQAELSTPAAQTYLLFPDGTDAASFGSEATISTKGSITASVENDGDERVFSIQDGKVVVADTRKVSTATVILVNGTYTLRVPLTKIPVLFTGSGTEQDPYIISTRQDLENMADMTNGATVEHFTGKYFRQSADIDMGGTPFDGIACVQTGTNYPEKTYWFAGIYDGGGHKISNLVVDRVRFDGSGTALSYTVGGGSAQNVGLFGTLGDGARVSNLTIASGKIQGYFNVGAIAGYAMEDVRISDCTNAASVTAYEGTAGGILGVSNSAAASFSNTITRCVNSGDVLANCDEAGGIIGYSKSVLTDCVNLGSVTIRRFNACIADEIPMDEAGGIAGTNQGNMTYCANFGAVTNGGGKTGGLAGFSSAGNKRGDIIGCYNAAPVKGADMSSCGALIGENYNILSTSMVQKDCAYDAQYSGCQACDNAEATFAMPLLTSELVSGDAYLPAGGWIMQAGFYPINKALASHPAVRAACASYVLMPQGQSALDFRSGKIPSAMNLTVTAAGSGTISVSGDNVTADVAAAEIAVTDITLSTGGHSRTLSLQYIPDVLPGKGTQDEPFMVSTADDFNKVSSYMLRSGTSYSGKFFKVTADLDFSGKDFVMAGQNGNYFAGEFDGCGHTVSNIKTSAGAQTEINSAGIFGGIAQGGVVKGLRLKGLQMEANLNGGLLAGTVSGTVTDIVADSTCSVTGVKSTVLFTSAKGENIGGICGLITASGRIENCVSAAAVTGYKYVGGITGNSDYSGSAVISGCENRGVVLAMAPAETQPPTGGGAPVTKTVDAMAGGIAGQMAGTISRSRNSGTVTANPCKVAGGIIGQMYVRTIIEECENHGTVYARDYVAGGIAGQSGVGTPASGGIIRSCRNYGSVQAVNQVGGITGILKAYTTVQKCANMSDIRPGGMRGGGIAGEVTATVSGYDAYALIEDCYNTGSVSGNGYNAGIVGYAGTKGLTVNRCFNTGSITATTANGGAAGIANMYGAGCKVLNSYNAGDISGKRNVGGICGNSTGVAVTNAYCIGDVVCGNETYRETAAGHIVAAGNDAISVSNCYYVPMPDSFPVDDLYTGIRSMSASQLFEAPLGDSFMKQPYCFPVLTALDTVAAAKVSAAYFQLHDGDTQGGISHSFPLGLPEGLSWSATGNIRIDNGRAYPAGTGAATLTASCGGFSRTYSFSSTTGVDTVSDADPVVRTEYYLPSGCRVMAPERGTAVITVSVHASGNRTVSRQVIR